MELSKAIELFSIEDLFNETEDTLKKKYKKLMLKYHPDNYGDDTKAKDIQLAFNTLKDALKKVKQLKFLERKTEKWNVIIPINKLIDIYKGQSIKVGNSTEYKELDNKGLRRHNVIIISDVCLTHNGMVNTFNSAQPWLMEDEYDVYCDITVDDLDKVEKVHIKLDNIEKDIQVKSQSVKFKLSLEYNIKVNIIITKRLVKKKYVSK